MGADYIAVHTGYDLQAKGVSPLESLRTVKSVITNSKVVSSRRYQTRYN